MKVKRKPLIFDAYRTDVELTLPTLEGPMHASVGDWIVTGILGERWPVKPEVFKLTYETEF